METKRATTSLSVAKRLPRVVIVGGGFAGLHAARRLQRAPVEVVLIDRRNHHLFQPLLYQVATAALSPADIAVPIRKVLRGQKNASVILGEVDAIEPAANRLRAGGTWIDFDYLILATGVTHSYFNRPDWAQKAPGLKSVEDALEIRRRFLLAFEEAEVETDPDAQRAAMTFAIIGAGPTGLELAGAIAEIARTVVPKDFRRVDTRNARVVLIEAAPRVLPTFSETSGVDALKQLTELGVEVRTNTKVTEIDDDGVTFADGSKLIAREVFWAAGVKASPLGAMLGVPLDNAGRVTVEKDCSVAGYPNVFVVGDLAKMIDPKTSKPVPGVAQGALQSGAHAAKVIEREVLLQQNQMPLPARPDFVYHDKGSLATIGRHRAVGVIGRWHPKGVVAWLFWALIHVLFLVTFRNRIVVMANWIWSYVFFDRGARLITGDTTMKVVKREPVPEAVAAQRLQAGLHPIRAEALLLKPGR